MKWKSKILKTVQVIVFALLLVWLLDTFAFKGFIGWLIILLVFSAYRMYQQRNALMSAIKYMETILFGKPLDKDFWKKGEKPEWRRIKNDKHPVRKKV